MGCELSKDILLRRELRAPPYDCCSKGVHPSGIPIVGTYALDSILVQDPCYRERVASAAACTPCESPRGVFSVPYPCSFMGSDCCCCPGSPSGPAWQSALGTGFGDMLRDAAQIIVSSEAAPAPDVSRFAALGTARQARIAPWVESANAFLSKYGLSCAVYSYIEEKRDNKGVKTGEVLWSAVQIYRGSPPPAVVLPAGAAGGLAPPGVNDGSGGGGAFAQPQPYDGQTAGAHGDGGSSGGYSVSQPYFGQPLAGAAQQPSPLQAAAASGAAKGIPEGFRKY